MSDERRMQAKTSLAVVVVSCVIFAIVVGLFIVGLFVVRLFVVRLFIIKLFVFSRWAARDRRRVGGPHMAVRRL